MIDEGLTSSGKKWCVIALSDGLQFLSKTSWCAFAIPISFPSLSWRMPDQFLASTIIHDPTASRQSRWVGLQSFVKSVVGFGIGILDKCWSICLAPRVVFYKTWETSLGGEVEAFMFHLSHPLRCVKSNQIFLCLRAPHGKIPPVCLPTSHQNTAK